MVALGKNIDDATIRAKVPRRPGAIDAVHDGRGTGLVGVLYGHAVCVLASPVVVVPVVVKQAN